MNKHTPGPWVVQDSRYCPNSDDPPPLVCTIGRFSILAMCEVKSDIDDASLISVAPEMLEALQEIADIVLESQGIAGYHLNGEVADWDSLNLKLFDVIAKATGSKE